MRKTECNKIESDRSKIIISDILNPGPVYVAGPGLEKRLLPLALDRVAHCLLSQIAPQCIVLDHSCVIVIISVGEVHCFGS